MWTHPPVLAIVLIYTILMGTAALSKLKEKAAPEWFLKPFEGTLIARLPGGARGAWWIIAVSEGLLALAFAGSLAIPAVLPAALTGSLFLFAILCLGLRLSHDYQGSANMFIYFAATLISYGFAEKLAQ